MSNFKYCFLGSPDLCLPILENLLKEFGKPEFIITNPPRPIGRKQTVTKTPVHIWATDKEIATFTPEKVNKEFVETLPETDLAIVVAYGQILPNSFINYPKLGTINVHYSLLPRHRGASPVEASILKGDILTGVTIQQMVKELDAGPILSQEKFTLTGLENGQSLEKELNKIAQNLLIETINKLIKNQIQPQEQDHNQATFCYKIKKEDSELKKDDSEIVKWRKFRAYFGWPRVFYFDEKGKRVIVTDAEYKNNIFIIKKIIKEGEKEKII